MRLFTSSLFALAVASPLFAETVYTQAPVAAATVYPRGAELIHRATVELPAGVHRIFLPYAGLDDLASLPRIRTSEGVTIGALGFRRAVAVDRAVLFTQAQAAAFARIEALKAEIAAKEDAIAAAGAEVKALKARLAFIGAVKPGKEMGPEALLAMADTLKAETETTHAAIVAAAAALRPLSQDLDDLKAALKAARREFERLSPPEAVNDMLSVEVSVAEAGPVTLELTELSQAATWQMDYDLDLDREAGQLAIERKLIVAQQTGATWAGVALTLSTARPGEDVGPSPVNPDRAWIHEPVTYDRGLTAGAPAPMMEEAEMPPEPMALEGAKIATAELQIDGLALSYVYPDAVTIASDEAAELALDTLTLDATPAIHAAPRYDDTAFVVATLTNSTQEPILPGWANILRDGHLVGRERIEMIPAGDETTLAFGPIEGIRLDTIFVRKEEGGSGIISRSNTREQEITFTVENLTGEDQQVRAFFPLTFSEQEDLRVRVTANPAPDETDIDMKRGVSAWDLSLAAGETQAVSIRVQLDWPEGQELNWYP